MEPLVHDGMQTARVNLPKGHAFLSMFIERGRYSQHVYQPQINHRSLEYNNYHSTMIDDNNQETIPLIESMTSTDLKLNFSSANDVNLVFYQMDEGSPEADTGRPIKTQNIMQVDLDDKTQILEYGTIDNRYAKDVNDAGLRRAFDFFNVKWNKTPGGHVETEDLVSFVDLLSTCDLSSVKAFQETVLDRFMLNELFVIDPLCCLEANLAAFGELLRAYVPIRIAVYDGQHRMALTAYFVIGEYEPMPVIKSIPFLPTRVKCFEEGKMTFPVETPESLEYKNMQMHCGQKVTICYVPLLTFPEVVDKLFNAGMISTVSQSIRIPRTLGQCITQFCTSFKASGLMKKMTPLNYKNFWKMNSKESLLVLKSNLGIMSDHLWRFTKDRGYEELFAGKGMKWNGSPDNNKKTKSLSVVDATNKHLLSYTYFLGKGREQKNNDLSLQFGWMMTLLKFLLHSPENVELLIAFFIKTSFESEQWPMESTDRNACRTITWAKDYILFPIHQVVGQVFKNLVLLEKKMLHTLRKMKNNPALQEVLDNHKDGAWDFTSVFTGDNEIQRPPADKKYSDDFFKTNDTSSFTSKLLYCEYAKKFADTFETINKMGFNPIIPAGSNSTNEGYNRRARSYIIGSDDVKPEELPVFGGTDRNSTHKCSMALMLELWPYYVTRMVNFDENKVEIFQDWIGDKSSLNTGKLKNCSKNSVNIMNGIIDKSRESDANNPYVFTSKKLDFSVFVDGVISGIINLDTIPEFQEFMDSHSNDEIALLKRTRNKDVVANIRETAESSTVQKTSKDEFTNTSVGIPKEINASVNDDSVVSKVSTKQPILHFGLSPNYGF